MNIIRDRLAFCVSRSFFSSKQLAHTLDWHTQEHHHHNDNLICTLVWAVPRWRGDLTPRFPPRSGLFTSSSSPSYPSGISLPLLPPLLLSASTLEATSAAGERLLLCRALSGDASRGDPPGFCVDGDPFFSDDGVVAFSRFVVSASATAGACTNTFFLSIFFRTRKHIHAHRALAIIDTQPTHLGLLFGGTLP